MRNTWLIIRREYLERVRSKAFIIFTILTPVLVAALVLLPSKLMMMKSGKAQSIAVVSPDPAIATAIQQQLVQPSSTGSDDDMGAQKFTVTLDGAPSEQLRTSLNDQVSAGKLDGYLWLTQDGIGKRTVTYATRNSSDLMGASIIQSALRAAFIRNALAEKGIAATDADSILSRVSLDTIRIEKGKETRSSSIAAFMLPFVLMFMIYMTVIIYGVAVMRSVIEEKTSRVVEVLLSSVRPMELMAGKIIGVGAVGLTQMLIWCTCIAALGTPGFVAAKAYLKDVQIPAPVFILFPIFFLLGYLLYAALYAAVGAMVNSDEEAQQVQWPVLLPLIACTVFASAVIRQPNGQLAFWLSLFPLTSPIIMFVRVASQMPPLWQVLLSIALLVGTIYAVVFICARIYRVGILMYGKRPTLPEIIKWIKYA